MISVVVSAISIVVIITVTVVLVTTNQKAHSEQKQQLRKVISDVNSVNTTTAEVDKQQNNSILSLNSNVMLARTSTNNLKTFVDSSFSNLSQQVSSDRGMFNSVKTNDLSINNIPFTVNQNSVALGTMFNVGIGASNTGYMTIPGVNQMNFNIAGSNVFSLCNMSMGIGMTPQYGNALEVNGAVWTRGGLMTSLGAGIDTLAPVITNDATNIYINSNNKFTTGVNIGHSIQMDSRAKNNPWTINTNYTGNSSLVIDPLSQSGSGFYRFNDDGRFTINGSNAGISIRNGNTNTYTEFPNSNGVNMIVGPTSMNGPFVINGAITSSNAISFAQTTGTMMERKINDTGSKYGIGYTNNSLNMYISGVDPASKLSIGTTNTTGDVTEQVYMNGNGNVRFEKSASIANNLSVEGVMTTRNSAVRNTAGDYWFSYLDGTDLYVTPSTDSKLPPNAASVSMKFTKTGDFTAPKNISAGGDVAATGSVSGSTVTGTQLCSGTECLTQQQISNLKAILNGTATINANQFCIKNGDCITNARMGQIAAAYP